MSGLIVIDVVIFAVLIMIATVIVVTRARRIGRRYRSGAVAAESAGAGMGLRDTPLTPGLHEEGVKPDRGAREPAEANQAELQHAEPEEAELEQAEAEQAELQHVEPEEAGPEPADPEQPELQHAEPEEAEPEQAGLRHAEPEKAEPEPAEPELAESPQASEAAVPDPGRNGSAGEPAGHQDGAGPVAGSGQIGSYYEGADREIADYLAERGWPQEPGAHDPAGRA